ncbi:MAG: heavy metal translocating P-type ATPase [Campylobacterota bacterium]
MACDHCDLEFDKAVMIEDGDKHFCCRGCQGVYHLLKEDGLESFYAKKGDTKLTPVSQKSVDLGKFDLEGFASKYIKQTDEGYSEVSLIIEHIHCAACVWLNEKILHQSEGIIEANINYTDHKAKIVWDPDKIKLSQIIEKIQAIGYDAYAYDPKVVEQKILQQRKDYYIRLAVAIFATMNIMWLAVAKYFGFFSGMEKDVKFIISSAEWALATPTLFFSGWVFYRGAYFGLKNKIINMDLLVASGASLIYFYSIYVLFSGTGETYFDSATMIVTFILVGKFLEVLSKKNATDSLDNLRTSIPEDVVVLKQGIEKTISANQIQKGDHCVLKSGDLAVVDGTVLDGSGSVDESALTGESQPVYKTAGDAIISGSTSIDTTFIYEAKKDFEHSTLNSLATLLEKAQEQKPRIQEKTNELSRYFSAGILTVALLTFLGWFVSSGEFEPSFVTAVAVIIIACPCALALATPVATLAGLSSAYKKGVLFKQARYLETMAGCQTLLLDKTGTITRGSPEVTEERKLVDFDKGLLAGLIKDSKHPISKALYAYLGTAPEAVEAMQVVEAKGIRASHGGKTLLGGSKAFLEENGIAVDNEFDASHFIYAVDGEVIAWFVFEDAIKEGAYGYIKEFQKMGLHVAMVTGDNAQAAQKVAHAVGIDEVYAQQDPKQKAKLVESFEGGVIMAGDGINDSLAMSKAHIACVMGSGADVSIKVSDVVLLHSSLQNLRDAVAISKTTLGFVKQNLGISLVYNVLTIPLAIAGYVIPLVAALSMSLSSLIVIGNSMRIRLKHG